MKSHYWLQREGIWIGPRGLGFVGYSGRGEGKNNPAMQFVKNVGPLPCGLYLIGPLTDLENKRGFGPGYLVLSPNPANDMRGRSGFLAHWDKTTSDGIGPAPDLASEGCIAPYDGTNLARIDEVCKSAKANSLWVVTDFDAFVLKAMANGERG